MSKLRERFTTAIALAALFVSLGGSAYAVTKNSVTSKQVKNNSLTGQDIRTDSLTGGDVDESTLQIAAGAGPVGPPGPAGPLSGPAGGALSGEYPNPELAANSVGSTQIAANAVSSSEIASNSIDGAEVENGGLDGVDVGRAAGIFSGFNPGPLAGGACVQAHLALDASQDLSSEAFALTMGDQWIGGLTVTPQGTPTAGADVQLTVCNQSTQVVDQPAVDIRWVAFDV